MALRWYAVATGVSAALLCGCASSHDSSGGARSDGIVDVPQTPVERQSIGNCWLYAEASWIESMHLSATGEVFDISQSYWTYWHWFDQIAAQGANTIETGGNNEIGNRIVALRGLVRGADFVATDPNGEMSERQKSALEAIQRELASGRLSAFSGRGNGALIRQVLDDAWDLPRETRAWLDRAFGADASRALTPQDTPIVSPGAFQVRYADRSTDSEKAAFKTASLSHALADWHSVPYPADERPRRDFLVRVQKALHDRQPVLLSWDVDFNALESGNNERRGSFNMTTLRAAGGPGTQGGHMVVLEDYQATTESFGLLRAGTTLDPNQPADKSKLDAALLPSTQIQFLRVKNSWGTFREDRGTVPGFPGYHDLYMDYLNGPIAWCPGSSWFCGGMTIPLRTVGLPPGY
ncbi:hypothetical protein LZC95_27665 [Pendulispora brunnea]|uniref:Uncharacterized protein n=1 Tax=Pendulispora brunnea TaxID=2905690 RepID=A0ABZ2JUT8_9BACT